jgi:hypothetical protein
MSSTPAYAAGVQKGVSVSYPYDGYGGLMLFALKGKAISGAAAPAVVLNGTAIMTGAPGGSYIKADGSGYGTPSGSGIPYPPEGPVYSTGTAWGSLTATEISALWGCTGFLKNDGTCASTIPSTAPNPNTPTLTNLGSFVGTLITGSNDGEGAVAVSTGTTTPDNLFTLTFGGTYSTPMFCMAQTNSSTVSSTFVGSGTAPSATSQTFFTNTTTGITSSATIWYHCHQ